MIYVDSVTVEPKTVYIHVGEWYYEAVSTVTPTNATKKTVKWSSNNSDIASVGETNGYIFGVSIGTTRIYARSIDGSNKYDYITVNVVDSIPVQNIELNRTQLTLDKGEHYPLSVTVSPENADNKSVTWCSSDENVATVNDRMIHAVSAGDARITATAADGSGVSAFCDVHVRTDVVSEITIDHQYVTLTQSYPNNSIILHAEVLPADAANTEICWRSTNPEIATVNKSTGFVLAQSAGRTTVYAYAINGSGVRGQCDIYVTGTIAIDSVAIDRSIAYLTLGNTMQLSANIEPEEALTEMIRWESNNENVATVDPVTGQIQTIGCGLAKISAFAVDSNIRSTCTVAVKPIGRSATDIQTIFNLYYQVHYPGCIEGTYGLSCTGSQHLDEEPIMRDCVHNCRSDGYRPKLFWNSGYTDNQYSEEDWGLTDKASETDNWFGNGIQCFGFALFIGKLLFGAVPNYGEISASQDDRMLTGGWYYIGNQNGNMQSVILEPGDIIRTTTNHSAIVRYVDHDSFWVCESLGSIGSELAWGYFNANRANNTWSKVKNNTFYVLKHPTI